MSLCGLISDILVWYARVIECGVRISVSFSHVVCLCNRVWWGDFLHQPQIGKHSNLASPPCHTIVTHSLTV